MAEFLHEVDAEGIQITPDTTLRTRKPEDDKDDVIRIARSRLFAAFMEWHDKMRGRKYTRGPEEFYRSVRRKFPEKNSNGRWFLDIGV